VADFLQLLAAIESSLEVLTNLKLNSVKQEQHNLDQVGLGCVFKDGKEFVGLQTKTIL
jgi:hypothetical protein